VNTQLLAAIFIGVLTITSYRATPSQTKPECTDNDNCETATGEKVHEGGIAVSRDLLCPDCRRLHKRCSKPEDKRFVHYGDWIFIGKYGYRQVNDVMGPYQTARVHGKVRHIPIVQHIDIFVATKAEEKAVGVKHLPVWEIEGALQ
jgi:hypothetical protein